MKMKTILLLAGGAGLLYWLSRRNGDDGYSGPVKVIPQPDIEPGGSEQPDLDTVTSVTAGKSVPSIPMSGYVRTWGGGPWGR